MTTTNAEVPFTFRTAWILECGCEPEIQWCEQCDNRRKAVALVKLEEAVELGCQAIYRDFEGYWPNESERARIASALLAQYGRASWSPSVS